MIRINLLPHREEMRQHRRKQFYSLSAAMVVLGALIGLLGHTIYARYIGAQEERNAFLKSEIVILDQQIAEIRRLREQIDALLARKQVIESLQSTRAETVHLFNELAQVMPEGVYLKSAKQNGPRITLVGYAQSNARVSHLMRNVDGSAFLEQPALVEVKAATVNNRRVSEFTLNVSIKQPKQEQAAAKTAAPAAGKGVAK
ncbi:MAG: PilN domain-containing protein [Proteobacteria bacterium]|nr:PilN domain-containing protein [Pseudomonadota bacterium]MBS0550991.1 PilN domain-containing protein [Pseudomonadota bacterium]